MIEQRLRRKDGTNDLLIARIKEVLTTHQKDGWTPRSWSIGAGLDADAIRNILRGRSQSPRVETLDALARFAGCSLDWLRGNATDGAPGDDEEMRVEAPDRGGQLPLIGYIGAGDAVYHFGISEAREFVTPPPDVKRGIAALVRGASMLPVYRDGDLVIGVEHLGSVDELVGADCFVQVHDGPLLLKMLRRGAKGRYHLDSYNSATARIENQPVEWAAPVTWVKRSKR